MISKHPYPAENEQFPLLEKLKGTVPRAAAPENYTAQFENQVLQTIRQGNKTSTGSKLTASIFISFAWIGSAAACFFLTFQFSLNQANPPVNNSEMAFILEELHYTSEEDLHHWISQNQQEVTQEILLNEFSEYELYTE
jgi:hypothetical protein